jgi:hypothetical protein
MTSSGKINLTVVPALKVIGWAKIDELQDWDVYQRADISYYMLVSKDESEMQACDKEDLKKYPRKEEQYRFYYNGRFGKNV